MAKRSISFASVTTAATADAVALGNTTYPTILQGGSGTQRINIIEVMLGGQSGSTSQPQIMLLSRDSTVGVTLGATSTVDSAFDSATAALAAAPISGNAFTTAPQRQAAGHLMNFSFNAYGGAARWLAKDGEEVNLLGNTQPLGEVSLSAFTGTTAGAIGGHLIYEPF